MKGRWKQCLLGTVPAIKYPQNHTNLERTKQNESKLEDGEIKNFSVYIHRIQCLKLLTCPTLPSNVFKVFKPVLTNMYRKLISSLRILLLFLWNSYFLIISFLDLLSTLLLVKGKKKGNTAVLKFIAILKVLHKSKVWGLG